jgi:hypothetical protein
LNLLLLLINFNNKEACVNDDSSKEDENNKVTKKTDRSNMTNYSDFRYLHHLDTAVFFVANTISMTVDSSSFVLWFSSVLANAK